MTAIFNFQCSRETTNTKKPIANLNNRFKHLKTAYS